MSASVKRQFIYVFEAARPELVTDATAWGEEEEHIAESHFAYLQQATRDGIVLLAGRSLDGRGPALVVFEAGSDSEALLFMSNDPFVASGLMRAQLHPFRAALVRHVSS